MLRADRMEHYTSRGSALGSPRQHHPKPLTKKLPDNGAQVAGQGSMSARMLHRSTAECQGYVGSLREEGGGPADQVAMARLGGPMAGSTTRFRYLPPFRGDQSEFG